MTTLERLIEAADEASSKLGGWWIPAWLALEAARWCAEKAHRATGFNINCASAAEIAAALGWKTDGRAGAHADGVLLELDTAELAEDPILGTWWTHKAEADDGVEVTGVDGIDVIIRAREERHQRDGFERAYRRLL